ncbi:hypothetical protein ACFE04_006018 [Oxalis oulophora]
MLCRDLLGNNFTGPIPAGIFNLPLLTKLILRNCSIKGNIPASIGNWTYLASHSFTFVDGNSELIGWRRTDLDEEDQGMDAFTGDVLHSFEHKHIVRACHFSEGNRENSTLTSAYDLTFYLCMVLILYIGGTGYGTSFIEFLNYQFWVGSEHLLLGLLREGEGVAAS